jgi:ABC-type multidrug transport system ATPase subunit
VLRRIDLRLAPGRAMAVLGANGSGKSTLLRIAATLLAPTDGDVRIFGAARGAPGVRGRLGFVSHESLLYDHLTVHENLTFFAGLYDGADTTAASRRGVDAIAREILPAPLLGRRVRLLSRGQRQLADLARALVHDPDLLILDEPLTGLDLDAAARLERLLRAQVSRGRTLLFATHDVREAQALADDAVVLHQGRLAEPVPADAFDEARLAALFHETRG